MAACMQIRNTHMRELPEWVRCEYDLLTRLYPLRKIMVRQFLTDNSYCLVSGDTEEDIRRIPVPDTILYRVETRIAT